MPLNPFVARSLATTKDGKLKKGFQEIKMKNGAIRYKKALPKTAKTVAKKEVKKSKAKVVQVKTCKKVTKENPDGSLSTDKKCEVTV